MCVCAPSILFEQIIFNFTFGPRVSWAWILVVRRKGAGIRGSVPTVISGRLQMNDIFAVIEIFQPDPDPKNRGYPKFVFERKMDLILRIQLILTTVALRNPFHPICRMDRLLSRLSQAYWAHVCGVAFGCHDANM